MNTIQLMRRSAVWSVAVMTVWLLSGTSTVHAQVCGNDTTEAPEICDGTDDTACPGACLPPGDPNECKCPVCGDGAVNGSEACDGSDDSACPGHCTATCTCAVCGDNVAEGPETCDGTDDSACPGLCPAAGDPRECLCPVCGDGIVNQLTEECDRHDDSACPAHCASNCACAVCGDNVAGYPVETCDGTDDVACPGLCFPPGDPHECVCPATLNKCASKKEKCVVTATANLVKCHEKAEGHALGPVDPTCVDKVALKFDGGPTPERGCFEKLELPSHCFTEDDTASAASNIGAFVDSVVSAVDPSYPAPIIDRCSVGKKRCVRTLVGNLLKCRAKYEAKNLPVDPLCIQKVLLKFDGGPLPERGCFEKLETKYVCMTTDDTAALESASMAFADGVACDLDPYQADCSTCGNNVTEAPPEECDGTDDGACPGQCSAACKCP